MRKLFCLTALYVTITGGALLTFGAGSAAAEDTCAPRPSGAPAGWRCVLTNLPTCEGGLCQCNYVCTPP